MSAKNKITTVQTKPMMASSTKVMVTFTQPRLGLLCTAAGAGSTR